MNRTSTARLTAMDAPHAGGDARGPILAGLPGVTGAVARSGDVTVWDRFVRLFHWGLAFAILIAIATGLALPATYVDLHIVAGSAAVVLIAARVIWGCLGPAPARFATFVRSPAQVLAHVKDLRRGSAPRHLGHNPLGGWMIIAVIGCITLLAITGLITLGGTLKSGPLAFMTAFATGEAARRVHQLLGYGLLGLIFLHLAGVIFESRRTSENLAVAILDGRKQRRPGDLLPPFLRPRPLMASVLGVVVLTGSAFGVLTLRQLPAWGAPSGPLDPSYGRECGDCHRPFHPSLAPRATWSAIMDHLDRHFGENATLETGETEKIRAYLLANSAELYDTKAANRLRKTDPSNPLRITATPFWRRMHAAIPQAVFAAKTVGMKSACGACHADAESGRFYPADTAIPEQAEP